MQGAQAPVPPAYHSPTTALLRFTDHANISQALSLSGSEVEATLVRIVPTSIRAPHGGTHGSTINAAGAVGDE